MKRTFLAKLHRKGLYCIIGALLLLVGIPLYQFLILIPSGYSNALATQSLALHWINTHSFLFLGYRALLFAGFAFMISMPFTLFRIIVAQEILGREVDEQENDDREEVVQDEAEDQSDNHLEDGMPAFAWRGKGFAVLAAWSGLFGLLCLALGILVSTLYLVISSASLPSIATNLENAAPLTGFFAILSYTVGGELLALSCLFFGAVIARSGLKLWPGIWVAFAYMALAIAVLFSVSAAEVAFAPVTGQSLITTFAILLFSVWVLCFGVMLVRLKPE
ncbi:MAG TPA: hypothetical protein VN954_00525 [Ktedonobacteraceae bacterium]|nr:hypothetical protein [Ktedonobacteraceae bacterium]